MLKVGKYLAFEPKQTLHCMSYTLKYPVFIILSLILCLSCKSQDKTRNTPTTHVDRSIIPFIDADPSDQIAEYVRNIFEDKDGNLWIGTNGYGVARYDGKELKYFDPSNGLSGSQVTDVMQSRDGRIWLTTYGGITVYDGKSFTNYTVKDGLRGEWMWSVYEDSKGQIWASSIEGVSKLLGDKFVDFDFPENGSKAYDERFSNQCVRDFIEIDGELWMATSGLGVAKYDGNNITFLNEENGLCNNDVDNIIQDQKGNIWISTRFGGVCKYDGKSFITYDTKNGIENNECIIVYEDNAGNIWFSSEGFGLYKYDESEILTNYAKNEGLGVRAVQTIFEDSQGRFWTGGGGGLYRLYGDTFVNVTKYGPWKK